MESQNEYQMLEAAKLGDAEALGQLLQTHFARLESVVRFRMDTRLYGRLEPRDVVQETLLEATKRFNYYLENKKTSFFLWLRYLALQKLNEMHRHHFGVKSRDKNREVSIFSSHNPVDTTAQIAAILFDDQTSPSQAMMRDESRLLIESALCEMDALDQEVLALRHFEQLTNVEVADALGLETSAASKRFVRALQRLRKIVEKYGEETT